MQKKVLLLSALIALVYVPIYGIAEKQIVIVAAGYNNSEWHERHLDSIFFQNYSNYHMVYIDDCSPDGTYDLVKTYIDKAQQWDRVTLIGNTERRGAMANQFDAIHGCADDAIVIIVDADDWLAHADVLAHINKVYQDESIWLTYGQFREYPSNRRGFCHQMPQYVVKQNRFRSYPDIPSHLRTFYAGLFKKITKEDLMYKEKFLEMSGDIAAMFPMIEMASKGHFKFIPDILLIYNAANSLNNYKISKKTEYTLDRYIRSKKSYDPIASPFEAESIHV